MGRRKISIAPIKDDRNRQVTFLKRKNGLFKKAYELGVLCSADVAVVVFNANGKLFEFHSGDMDQILLRYSHYAGPAHEKRGPDDYINKDLDASAKTGTGGKMTSLSDEDGSDDDEDDKPRVAAGSSGVRAIPQASKGKQAIRAQVERKSKGMDTNRSESVEGGTPTDSRTSSFSAPAGQYQPQTDQSQDAGIPQLAQDPLQNGYAAPAALPFPFGGLPNLTGNPGGLPNLTGQMFNPFSQNGGMPSFPGFPAGMAPNFPFPLPAPFAFGAQQQQPNGTSVPGTNGGVPAWFGALNPGLAQGQPPMAQAPHLQLLQQLSAIPGAMQGWPSASVTDPAAAVHAFQRQQHEAHQHQQAPQFTSPFGQPVHALPQSQPATSPTARPRPAPMYGTPAAMPPPPAPQQSQPTQSHAHGVSSSMPGFSASTPTPAPSGPASDPHGSRPGSVTSVHSHAQSHASPATAGAHASPHPDAWQNKPRLQVAIPAENGTKEGTKPGLVTAGGASMLGAGLGYGGGESTTNGQHHANGNRGNTGADVDEDADIPQSAFAADLLPSPLFPHMGGASSAALPYLSGFGGTTASGGPSQHFQWPTAPPSHSTDRGPAPQLGADEVSDPLRHASFADLTSAAAAAQAGEADDASRLAGADRAGGGRGTKRANAGDEDDRESMAGADGRKRRG